MPVIPEIQIVPEASNVIVTGDLDVGEILHANYDFYDKNEDTEGESIFQWYTAEASNGAGTEPIEGAKDTTYTLSSAESGKFLMFEVTPVANSETQSQGIAVRSDYTDEVKQTYDYLFVQPSRVYDFITIVKLDTYDLIQIFDIYGNIVYEFVPENNDKIDLSFLRAGIYFIKSEKGGDVGTFKITKI